MQSVVLQAEEQQYEHRAIRMHQYSSPQEEHTIMGANLVIRYNIANFNSNITDRR